MVGGRVVNMLTKIGNNLFEGFDRLQKMTSLIACKSNGKKDC